MNRALIYQEDEFDAMEEERVQNLWITMEIFVITGRCIARIRFFCLTQWIRMALQKVRRE